MICEIFSLLFLPTDTFTLVVTIPYEFTKKVGQAVVSTRAYCFKATEKPTSVASVGKPVLSAGTFLLHRLSSSWHLNLAIYYWALIRVFNDDN